MPQLGNIFWYLILVVAIAIPLAFYFFIFTWRPRKLRAAFRGRLLRRVNYARRKRGLKPLGRTRLLDNIAARHSRSMARRKRCDHHGFKNRVARIEKYSLSSNIGENCYMFPARKYDSHVAKKLVGGWLRSSGHRANLLNPSFRKTGIGIAVRRGYVYATQIFTD